MFSTPADPTAQSMNQNPVSSKGAKSNGNTFGSVLAQVTSQSNSTNQGNVPPGQQPSGSVTSTGPNGTIEPNAVSAPNGAGGPSTTGFTSVAETSVAVKESVTAGNANQLAQAEQALASLANGLAQIIQMISRLQQSEPQQAQAALSALKSVNLSPAELQAILNTLQPLIQNLPADQNPLLLNPSQQAAYLNQMFQQMMQAQQVLMGGGGANLSGSTTANTGVVPVGGVGTTNGQNAALEMFFDTNLANMGQAQSTQVFINLANFKMSATFIQNGTGASAGENSAQNLIGGQGQTATPINSQNVINELNQALANLNLGNPNSPIANAPQANNAANATGLPNNLSQNFKGLVQLLMQSGVTQAALTSFLNNLQKGGVNPNSANASQNAGQIVSANNLTQVLPVSSEIQPVIPPVLTGAQTNNANAGQGNLPGENNLDINELVSQAVISSVRSTANANTQGLNSGNPSQANNELFAQPELPPVQPTANANTQGLNLGDANQTNNVLSFRSVVPPVQPAPNENTQGLNLGNPNQANNELFTQPELPPVQPTANGNLSTNTTQNPQLLNNVQLPAVQSAGAGTSYGLNTKEIDVLNAVVASLNNSALHPTQGSLSMGSNVVLPSPALTMGQILGASEANQISSGSIVMSNGNPSVPLVPPVPLQAPLPVPNSNSVTLSQLAQSQQSQSQTFLPSTATGSPTIAGLTPVLPESVTPPVQPLVPGAQNPVLNNLASNNGVVSLPVENGTSTAPTAVSPTLPVTGGNAFNTPASNNPGMNISLPQPTTLPNSGTTPLPVNLNLSTPHVIAPTTLNQTGNPAPTSQAPSVPALASAGEAIKTEIPNQGAANNNNNLQTAVINSQPDSTIKSLSAEAVSPVVSVTPIDSSLNVSDVAGK